MREMFKRLITDFIEKDIKNILPREYDIPIEKNECQNEQNECQTLL